MNVITSELREQANEWRVRVDGGLSDTEKAEFDNWLAAAHEHREALAEAELFWSVSGRPDYLAQLAPVVKRHLEFAGSADVEEPVTKWNDAAFYSSDASYVSSARRGASRRLVGVAIALAACVAIFITVGGLQFFTPVSSAPPQYFATESSTTQVITLEDKTRIRLGEESVLELELTEEARLARLSQGSASFDVTSDQSRPFTVRTEIGEVLVTGTRFDVQLREQSVSIAVTEGSVEVFETDRSDGEDRTALILTANQAVELDVVSGFGQVYEVIPTQTYAATSAQARASRNERLTYVRQPLSAIVEDLNRYTDGPITISDEVAMLELSGTYDASDVDAILRSVEEALPVRVIAQGEGKRIVAK